MLAKLQDLKRKELSKMSIARTLTAGAAALSLVMVSGASFADTKPNAASRLSLASSPSMKAVRAASLKRKGASQLASVVLIGGLVIGGGLGIAAAAGAFGGKSKSP